MLAKKLLMLLASIFYNNATTNVHISNFTNDKKRLAANILFGH